MSDEQIENRKSKIKNHLGSPTCRNWLWFSWQVVLRIVFLMWLRYRAHGTRNIPESGGGLLIANHQSFLDPLLVGLPLHRPVSYIARDSLFRVPVVGWILRNTYVMPFNRDGGSPSIIKETIRRMEVGFLTGVFPEGTRSPDGTVGEFKPGFVALVRRVRLPVYPVGIAGANRALGRGSWFLKPCRVCVVFGEPISVAELERLSERGREAELVSLVRQRVIDCQREAEERLSGRWKNGEWRMENGERKLAGQLSDHPPSTIHHPPQPSILDPQPSSQTSTEAT
ncbi:MAG: 1-acyl-sn-glycerol-3-phosphate acyltransferase [Planctomycetales bacterium]|nr:1-acyl-sn-glycerol-3-phosphate acyltransferase [Planctomycetales bacterium]